MDYLYASKASGIYFVFVCGSREAPEFEAGISAIAIVLATGVSGAIGLFFGVFPARQAAKLDPIVALRTA